MEVKIGDMPTCYGPGVEINLSGDEVAIAINTYLTAHGITIKGPRTITVNGDLCRDGQVYVDPSGVVFHDGTSYEGKTGYIFSPE